MVKNSISDEVVYWFMTSLRMKKKHKSTGKGFYKSYFYILKSIKMTLMYPLRFNKENSKIFNSEIS